MESFPPNLSKVYINNNHNKTRKTISLFIIDHTHTELINKQTPCVNNVIKQKAVELLNLFIFVASRPPVATVLPVSHTIIYQCCLP